MQRFDLTILGSSSATPTSKRNPSSQLLNVAERYFLIDCGEGTQMQLRRYKVKFQRIEHIMISHLHGDHYLGLMGLLLSMHLLGRTDKLHLYGPAELKEILDVQLKHSQTTLAYELIFHPINNDAPRVIFEDEKVSVETIILNHRVPCTGFLFREKTKFRNLKREMITKYSIPVSEILNIKNGSDFVTQDGITISNNKITGGENHAFSYAYCSDTCYDENVIKQVLNVDCIYHESTFLEDMKLRAKETFHSTAMQAATVAKNANVKKLILGHFSARYKDLQPFLDEAKLVFSNTELGTEGERFAINGNEVLQNTIDT